MNYIKLLVSRIWVRLYRSEESPFKVKSDQDIRILPKGFIVKIGGLPFELAESTAIVGHKGNFGLLEQQGLNFNAST